jgi:type II secretory pathway component GspD/PulD (secretin)
MRAPATACRALRVAAVVTLAAAVATPGLAQDKPPAPAPGPAATPAPATAEETPPRPVEFLGPDAVRRPDGMIVRYYRVNYVNPDHLTRELDLWKSPKAQIGPAGPQFAGAPIAVGVQKTAAFNVSSNVLRIVETEENWSVLERILSMVDLPQPQVRVEAKVLELSWSDELRVGMASKVTRPVGDTFLQSVEATYPNPLDALNGTTARFRSADKYLVFDYALTAVEQGAKADVISQPSILASQGETAVIRAGDEEPYVKQNLSGNTVTTSTEFRQTGIKLEVQPLLVGRDAVRVRILAEASRVSDYRITATSANQQVVNPVISTRFADTVVTVPNGETLVIGGLEQTLSKDVKTGIPLLKDIPVLGYLFGSTTKQEQRTELFFWITLTIERPEEARLFVPQGERERAARDAEKRKAPSDE